MSSMAADYTYGELASAGLMCVVLQLLQRLGEEVYRSIIFAWLWTPIQHNRKVDKLRNQSKTSNAKRYTAARRKFKETST